MTQDQTAESPAGDDFGTIMKKAADGIQSAVKSGVAPPEAVNSVVRAAVRGALGGGDVAVGVKAILMGAIRGTGQKQDAALASLEVVARAVVRQTVELNGNVAAASKGLLQGASACARQIGVDLPKAVDATRAAAVAEAETLGSVAAEKVVQGFTADAGVPAPH